MSYKISNQYIDSQLEERFLATLIKFKDRHYKTVDNLSYKAFSSNRGEYYQNIATSIEDDRKIDIQGELPEPFATVEETIEASERIASNYQNRLIADLFQGNIENLSQQTEIPSDKRLATLQEDIAGIQQVIRDSKSGKTVKGHEAVKRMMDMFKKRYDAIQSGKKTIGIPTGYGLLDRKLLGLQEGLFIIGGEPGTGKTTFVTNLAGNAALNGYPVLFVTLEEPVEKLQLKAFQATLKLDLSPFLEGKEHPEKFQTILNEKTRKLEEKIEYLDGLEAKIDFTKNKATAIKMLANHKVDRCLIVVDYLQKWTARMGGEKDFRFAVGDVVAELRSISHRLHSPVVLISSVNRETIKGRNPNKLTAFKESGEIEYSADCCIYMSEKESQTLSHPRRCISFDVVKNRYGEPGEFDLIFDPEKFLFESPHPSPAFGR